MLSKGFLHNTVVQIILDLDELDLHLLELELLQCSWQSFINHFIKIIIFIEKNITIILKYFQNITNNLYISHINILRNFIINLNILQSDEHNELDEHGESEQSLESSSQTFNSSNLHLLLLFLLIVY